MSGPFMPEWLEQVLAPADASRVRSKRTTLPPVPKIGPLAARNDPRWNADRTGSIESVDDGVLGSGQGQGVFDVIPGLSSIRGIKQARDFRKQGGSLPLALGMGLASIVPEGAAAVKLGGKGLGKLMAAIAEHKAGGTLTATGERFAGTGFAVADPRFTIKSANQNDLLAFFSRKDVRQALADGKHIGTWTDPETGITEVNLSDILQDRQNAISLGRSRNEKAIGHLTNGEYQGDISLADKPLKPSPGPMNPMTGEPLTVAGRAPGTPSPEHQAKKAAGLTEPRPKPDEIVNLRERIARRQAQLPHSNGEYRQMLEQDLKIMSDRLAALTKWDKNADPITQAAMRDKKTGKHWSGMIHDDARAEAALDTAGEADLERGFSTKSGRFLTEKEAGITNSKQIGQAMTDSIPSVVKRAVKHRASTGQTLPLDVSIDPPGVDASRPKLYRPKKADLSVLEPVKRRVREVYTPAAERGLRENPIGAAWYDMSPLERAFIDESPTGREDFKMFMDLMGPTSAGTSVPMNMRQASFFYKLWKEGKLTRDMLLNRGIEIPEGYGNRLRIAESLDKVLFGEGLDPITTPKTFRYSGQLGGRHWGGVALDRHVGRNVGVEGFMEGGKASSGGNVRAFPTSKYAESGKVTSSPENTHYAAIEDAMVSEADKMGVHPAAYQAAGWVGNAKVTNVEDARHPLEILNEKLGDTATKYGYKNGAAALRAFIRGETPLWGLAGAGATSYGLLGTDDEDEIQ